MRTRVAIIEHTNQSAVLIGTVLVVTLPCWGAAPLVTRRCAMLTYLFMVRTNSVMQCRVGWCGDGEIPPASLPPPTLSWQPAASPARGRWRLPQSSVLGDGSLEELRHNTNNFLAPGGTTQQQYNGNTLRGGRTQVIYAISTQYLRRHQRSRYIYANKSSQWWTYRSGRRATAPSSSTAWRASRSRRRTTRTTTSDTTSVSGLYHHRIMTDNVMNPPTRIYRTSHSGFNTSIFDRILIWKPMLGKAWI